ncbi:MAG: hypothetical protein C5B52_06550 [Bacteroidetes bacterium]|nr:MAG: hypothetical protein C5B52_06550 [Bacteroidota bacterium]
MTLEERIIGLFKVCWKSFSDTDKWFERKDLPKSLISLNYAAMAFTVLWPLLFVQFFLFFDSPGAVSPSRIQRFLVTIYPILSFVSSQISFWTYKRSRLAGFLVPIITIILLGGLLYSLYTLNY